MSNVYAFPSAGITVPAIVVGYPEAIDLEGTFSRGMNEVTLPVWYALAEGQTSTVDVRDGLAQVLKGGQMADVLSGVYAWGATHCPTARIEYFTVQSVKYIGVRFDVDVMTSGPVDLSAVMDGIAAACTAAGL